MPGWWGGWGEDGGEVWWAIAGVGGGMVGAGSSQEGSGVAWRGGGAPSQQWCWVGRRAARNGEMAGSNPGWERHKMLNGCVGTRGGGGGVGKGKGGEGFKGHCCKAGGGMGPATQAGTSGKWGSVGTKQGNGVIGVKKRRFMPWKGAEPTCTDMCSRVGGAANAQSQTLCVCV